MGSDMVLFKPNFSLEVLEFAVFNVGVYCMCFYNMYTLKENERGSAN